ncbi:MAG: response regulator [Pseudomonadota bacterium]
MNIEEVGRPIQVLMVEDSPDDVLLTREAFADAKVRINLDVVTDGVKALAYLRREQPYVSAPLPDLILLDLNLPRKRGTEVLEEIKMDRNLRQIPVVILTSSANEEDIAETYSHHANCYITKPVDFDQFSRVVRTIKDFWFTIVKLPGR